MKPQIALWPLLLAAPFAVPAPAALADRTPAKPLVALRLEVRNSPRDPEPLVRLAATLAKANRTPEAISAYRRAVALAPYREDARREAERLAGWNPLDQVTPLPTRPALAHAPEPGDPSGAPAVVLLDDARQLVYPDGATVTRIHELVRILDTSGVNRFRDFPLSTGSCTATLRLERARVLKPDGTFSPANGELTGTQVHFPELAPGDTIELSYEARNYHAGPLAHEFWSQWSFANPHLPTRVSRFALVTPAGLRLNDRRHGPVPAPTVRIDGPWKIRDWRMKDLPAVGRETVCMGDRDVCPWVDLSTIRSWKQVVSWYTGIAGPCSQPDETMRAAAQELTRDAHDEISRVKALVAFVSHEVHYRTAPYRLSAYVPQPADRVLRERIGDCKDKAVLLTALLASVGIRSDMVLLTARSEGMVPYLPSPRFAHVVSRVHTASGALWVDCTADGMEFGGLPQEDQGVPALVIAPETTGLVLSPTLATDRNGMADTHVATLEEDGSLSGSMELTASGNWGWILRTALTGISERLRQIGLRGLVARMVPNSHLSEGTVAPLEESERPVRVNLRYEAAGYATCGAGTLTLRLPWSGGTPEAPLAGAPGNQGAEVSSLRGHYTSSVRLALPEGFRPRNLESEVTAQSPFGSYRLTYRLENGTLVATREFTMDRLRVPAEEVPQFSRFLRALDQETHRSIVLEKITATAQN